MPRGFGSIPWRRLLAERTDLLRRRDARFLVYNPDEVIEAPEREMLERLERDHAARGLHRRAALCAMDLADALLGSARRFDRPGACPGRSINFVASHDGFTLADLVTYNRKHNETNGEENRDGGDHNRSWNSGEMRVYSCAAKNPQSCLRLRGPELAWGRSNSSA